MYIQAEDPRTYDATGNIQTYTTYGSEASAGPVLQPGTYAWRLRDPVCADGDPSAYPEGDGYNSQRARTELATRRGFAGVLNEMGLGRYGVAPLNLSDLRESQLGGTIFIKPNRVNDISEQAGTRSRLVPINEVGVALAGIDDPVLQLPEPTIAVSELADHLGATLNTADLPIDSLQAVRIFTPLWLSASEAPAVELRLTDPREGVGKFFATQQYLLEPEHVRSRLPQLADLHQRAHRAFRARYGEQNYLTFDYIIHPDGSAKLLNGLVRGLTPNLEHQRPEVQHLATATADVEVRQLARLALTVAER